MNIFDPEGSRRMGLEMRYRRFHEAERMGLAQERDSSTFPIDMPTDLGRGIRWRSFFRFHALTHRHLEGPAYR
ncbi:MAG: hypothetical protein ACM3S1_02390 [Hyphomicrobiales bacterium]